MLQHEIYKIYGTAYKDMTIRILEESNLQEAVRNKAEAMGINDATQLRIGIKPNLVAPTPASFGATTHTEVVAGIIEYLQARDFNDIKSHCFS